MQIRLNAITDFIKLESAAGLTLICAAILAMLLANSVMVGWYEALLSMPVKIQIGTFQLDKPMLLWVNDGLMAIFFLLIGLELKREILEGELSDFHKIALPALGACGGMLLPAGIYLWINWGDAHSMSGWAIPAATDIAFAMGVLALLGARVPASLKIFLISVAIFDDIGAIVIIALFYSGGLSHTALLLALCCIAVLYLLHRMRVAKMTPYLLVGAMLWVMVLKSGVHATLAGVVLAMFIPLRDASDPGRSPLRQLEHDLHASVAFGILPLFAFMNAGISLTGVTLDAMLHGVPLGIAIGLFFGKQAGVMLFCWLGCKSGIATLPAGMTWAKLYGVALLCGIGFTMSLFIGSLAFQDLQLERVFDERMGILIGSLLSALAGYIFLRRVL